MHLGPKYVENEGLDLQNTLTLTASFDAVQVGWTIGWIKPMNAKYENGACDGSNMHCYQCNMHCYYWLQSKWDKQIMDEAAFSQAEHRT